MLLAINIGDSNRFRSVLMVPGLHTILFAVNIGDYFPLRSVLVIPKRRPVGFAHQRHRVPSPLRSVFMVVQPYHGVCRPRSPLCSRIRDLAGRSFPVGIGIFVSLDLDHYHWVLCSLSVSFKVKELELRMEEGNHWLAAHRKSPVISTSSNPMSSTSWLVLSTLTLANR